MSPDDDDDVYYYMARDMNESCPPMTERCPALIPPFTTRSSSVMDLNRVMTRLDPAIHDTEQHADAPAVVGYSSKYSSK